MNRADVEMLNQSLQNLGENELRRNQLKSETALRMRQLALEQEMRNIQEARYNAQQQHYSAIEQLYNQRGVAEEQRLQAADQRASSARIQADLVDPSSGTKMTFTGTPQQLQQMQDSYQQRTGKELQVSSPKQFAASFNVGGATFSFGDQQQADKFASDFQKNHGIDLYAQSGGRVGARSPFEQAMTSYQQAMDSANSATDPAQKQALLDQAKMFKAQADKLNTWAPKQDSTTTINRNNMGQETGRSVHYGSTPGATAQPDTTPDQNGAGGHTDNNFWQLMANPAPSTLTGGLGAPQTIAPTGTASTGAPTGQPPAQGALPTINSQDDYDALSPGTQYKDSFGRIAVKGTPK